MLIQKDGITRNILDSRLWEYQEKGYVVVKKGKNYHRAVQAGNEDTPKSVSSVSEGDTSVSFASAYADEENPGMSFLANYTAQLNRFRKAGWQ